ncbi:MAG: DUF3352 domain-containing protein [Synechococcaceae cyanobacterium]|nr:DUF3352 domain-containing protein [Synechococcaceae cyanobacterium]
MKARPFLAVVLVVTLLTLGLALGGWWMVWQRSPLRLQHHPLTVPRAARFVPRQAPLSLFLYSDAEEPVGYARAQADPRERRAAAATIERLRDGAFAAAGLDYASELTSWLAPEIALALIDSTEPSTAAGADPPAGGWLLALRSRDDDGARRFLQRFWQTRSLAGTDLQVTRYRGMGMISGRGALRGQKAAPLATAMIDDDLVLIASGRGVLEQALDVSQIDELNLAAQPRLAEGLERLGQGAALLVAHPEALEGWLGLPLPAAAEVRPTRLVAALRPEGRALRLDGLVDLPADPPLETAGAGDGPLRQRLLEGPIGTPESLALVQNPAAWREVPLLRPLLERATLPAGEGGPLPALVTAADRGPLLAAGGAGTWLMGSSPDQPPPEAIEAALAARGLVAAPLELGDRLLTVWTRLETGSAGDGGRGRDDGGALRLRAAPAGWRTEADGLAWWGGADLTLPRERAGGRRRRQLAALGHEAAPFRWVLGRDPALALLRPWQPWRLLSALAGGGLEGAVQGLGLALEPVPGGVHLSARLEVGHG